MLRRGASSKKDDAKAKEDVTDKKAAKKRAADEKAAQKKAAKEKAAAEKAAKKAAKKSGKEKPAKEKPAKAPRVKAPRAEAAGGGPRGVIVRRPKTSIYSVMLGISAAALTIGCLMLVLEIWTYGPPWTLPWNIPINLR